jgi:riboflavin kinase/FMN adenylyltransferase
LVGEIEYRAMMNIGYRPTVSDEHVLTIEVHLLDFDDDLYGQNIRIRCYKRLRDEKKFNDIGELKNQLQIDKKQVADFFNV